jgi:hypothetical protein
LCWGWEEEGEGCNEDGGDGAAGYTDGDDRDRVGSQWIGDQWIVEGEDMLGACDAVEDGAGAGEETAMGVGLAVVFSLSKRCRRRT